MKVTVLLALFILYTTLVCGFTAVWQDCAIPLKRKVYYTGVVVSPSTISIATQTSNHDISINVAASIKDYTIVPNTLVTLQVEKDGNLYYNGSVGDICTILYNSNRVRCPLGEGSYSLSFQYTLPPLPSGNYTITITTYDPKNGDQIGCLSVKDSVIGLGTDACTYTSTFSANMEGTVRFLEDNSSVIQVGPRGPDNADLGPDYAWGTFKVVAASPDLVGYSFQPQNYVWGLRGTLNESVTQTQFDGTIYIGWRPDVNNYEGAQLVYQGVFSWVMTAGSSPGTPAYMFKSGTVQLVPPYFYPTNFPYPLNIGNLGVIPITSNAAQTLFSINVERSWCRCNCDLGGIGHDNLLEQSNNNDSGLSGYMKGTIAICVVGGVIFIVAILLIIKLSRSKPRPVVYDDADLLDPQKPDYGTIAINEAFEAEEQEFN